MSQLLWQESHWVIGNTPPYTPTPPLTTPHTHTQQHFRHSVTNLCHTKPCREEAGWKDKVERGGKGLGCLSWALWA